MDHLADLERFGYRPAQYKLTYLKQVSFKATNCYVTYSCRLQFHLYTLGESCLCCRSALLSLNLDKLRMCLNVLHWYLSCFFFPSPFFTGRLTLHDHGSSSWCMFYLHKAKLWTETLHCYQINGDLEEGLPTFSIHNNCVRHLIESVLLLDIMHAWLDLMQIPKCFLSVAHFNRQSDCTINLKLAFPVNKVNKQDIRSYRQVSVTKFGVTLRKVSVIKRNQFTAEWSYRNM